MDRVVKRIYIIDNTIHPIRDNLEVVVFESATAVYYTQKVQINANVSFHLEHFIENIQLSDYMPSDTTLEDVECIAKRLVERCRATFFKEHNPIWQ